MQPISGHGAPIPGDRSTIDTPPGQNHIGNNPLSPVQRTTLEKLIMKIMSLSSLKGPEIWAGLYREVGVKHDAGLLSHHFPKAEQFLNTRLTQVQNSHATRQQLQQLTTLLPQGNNRQAVSDFIRQRFGQTVLSSLNPDQLKQVLTMLQSGKMTIPQPQQNHITDRTLLPAEHHTLNQQIVRLAAATDEQPVKLWAAVLKMVNLHSGDPIPSRVFPLLTQYLHASHTLSQQTSPPSLISLLASLKMPPDNDEQQMLEDACDQRFQQPVSAPLTPAQAQDLLNLLFSRRAERLREQMLPASSIKSQPIAAYFSGYVPLLLQPLTQRRAIGLFFVLVVVSFILWVLF